jgi:hypothetical protein
MLVIKKRWEEAKAKKRKFFLGKKVGKSAFHQEFLFLWAATFFFLFF